MRVALNVAEANGMYCSLTATVVWCYYDVIIFTLMREVSESMRVALARIT